MREGNGGEGGGGEVGGEVAGKVGGLLLFLPQWNFMK